MIPSTCSLPVAAPDPRLLRRMPADLAEPGVDGLSLYEWQLGGVSVLIVRGELDYWSGAHLEERLIALVAQGRSRIVLDVGGLRFCDAGGMRILVRGHARARTRGGWLHLACANRRVRNVLTVVKLNSVLPIFESVGDAAAGRPSPP
jgi:anti-sigma B factor antagonist